MKKMKRIMCLLLACVLVLGMSMTVFAAGSNAKSDGYPYEISVADGDNHTYVVYQIFAGDVAEDEGKYVLSNVVWGENATSEGVVVGEKVSEEVFKALEDADASESGREKNILAELVNYVDPSDETNTYGTVSNGSPLYVPAGYYLIKDSGSITGDDAYTLYVVEVVGDDIKINRKSSTPEVEKEVLENSDESWGNSADYSFNEKVTFRLIGTLPDSTDYERYETYTYTFHDTLSSGLTFDGADSVNVYLAAVSKDEESGETSYSYGLENLLQSGESTYRVTLPGTDGWDGCTFEIEFDDLKNVVSDFNNNTVIIVEYTATLNDGAKVGNSDENKNTVNLEYSNNPNPGGTGTGKTPEKTVVVFTYGLTVNKTDGTNNLPGAGFTLYKDDPENEEADDEGWVKLEEIEAGEGYTFSFEGLDAGKYKLVESETPAGYNTIEDIIFEIVSTITSSDDGTSVTLKVVGEDGETELTDEDGKLLFVPSINDDTQDSGKLDTTIVNQKGVTLPSTGGIGTTIFYVIGGILVVGCGVILVTRKRVSR